MRRAALSAASRGRAAGAPRARGPSGRLAAFSSGAEARSETASGLLELLKQVDGGGDDPGGGPTAGGVLSTAGGVVRAALRGPVAQGQAVSFETGGLGAVLHYDRRSAVVAQVAGAVPPVGSTAQSQGALVVRPPPLVTPGGVAFASVEELLAAGETATASRALRMPAPPPRPCRRPVTRHLPCGLLAAELLRPVGEGHRIGLVGPRGAGKSAAARMLLRAQREGTACVYAAQRPLAELRALFGAAEAAGGAALQVVYSDPLRDPAGGRYLVPFCAMHVAAHLMDSHQHVLVVLDDLVAFAGAAEELRSPPFRASHAVAAFLDAAGATERRGQERALSVAAVLDLSPDEELERVARELWHGAEPSLDVSLGFSTKLAAKGIMPAIDVDALLQPGFPPPYHPPLLRLLRGELAAALLSSRELGEKLELKQQLQLHAETEEQEAIRSARVARSLLAHSRPLSLAELAVVATAAVVYHFPLRRAPSPSAVAGFQEAVTALIRDEHPAIWRSLEAADGLGAEDAASLLHGLGTVLLRHRGDFSLTRPEF